MSSSHSDLKSVAEHLKALDAIKLPQNLLSGTKEYIYTLERFREIASFAANKWALEKNSLYSSYFERIAEKMADLKNDKSGGDISNDLENLRQEMRPRIMYLDKKKMEAQGWARSQHTEILRPRRVRFSKETIFLGEARGDESKKDEPAKPQSNQPPRSILKKPGK